MTRLSTFIRLFAGQPAQDLCAIAAISALVAALTYGAPIVDALVRTGRLQ